MSTGKGFAKNKIMLAVIIALVVIALAVTAVILLTGNHNDLPPQSSETQGTQQPGTNPTEPDPTQGSTQPPAPAVTYTVTFKDHDGTVLDTQTVEVGKAATAPADPKRENFEFAGWDKAFDNITSDLVVTATYTTTKTVIYAEHVTVQKGAKEVMVNIRVLNNPGILGAVLKVSVNDQVFSFGKTEKTGYPGLTLTNPGPGTKSSPYCFVLDSLELSKEDKADGALFSITFKMEDAAAGKYDVKLSWDKSGIFDEDFKDIKAVSENGSITIQ